jgi:uncharacterized protein YkwD
MKRLLLTLLASVLTFGATFAQGDGAADETRMTLRAEMLRMINHDRQRFGLEPLELDPDASSVADIYCRLQIRNRTSGHFTLDGQTPYMRYSFAGGNDGLSENAAAWSANFGFSDRALLDMMRRSQEAMMSESAPHDGHRKSILDPYATHVGIGVAWEGGEFRIALPPFAEDTLRAIGAGHASAYAPPGERHRRIIRQQRYGLDRLWYGQKTRGPGPTLRPGPARCTSAL